MSLEAIIAALIPSAAITTIVGANCAMVELPQEATYPALVWTPISGVPVYPINAFSGPQLKTARVQFTCMARDLATVLSLRDAVKAAVNLQSGVFAGARVTSIILSLEGVIDKDEDARVFKQPIDYIVTFYDDP